MKSKNIDTDEFQDLALLVFLFNTFKFGLDGITEGYNYLNRPFKEIGLARDAVKGALVHAKENKNLDEIYQYNYNQLKDIIFAKEQILSKKNDLDSNTNSTINKVLIELANPFMYFVFGEKIATNSISEDKELKKELKQEVENLQQNPYLMEALAAVRLLVINGIINKAAWLLTDYGELLPSETQWLKATTVYQQVEYASGYVNQNIPKAVYSFKKDYLDNFMKLFNQQSKNLANVGLAILAQEPKAVALASFTAASKAYENYKKDLKGQAMASEKQHLKRYIEAKEKINKISEKNTDLKDIFNLLKEEKITLNLDEQLELLYKENRVLEKIFGPCTQKFKGEKEKTLFIRSIQDLISHNNNATGRDKIWDGDNISDKRVIVAKFRFAEYFKKNLKNFDQAEVVFPLEAYKYNKLLSVLFDGKCFKAANKLYTALQSNNPKAIKNALYLSYLAYTKVNKEYLNESKDQKKLEEISLLRMSGPRYSIQKDNEGEEIVGTYKYDLANFSFEKVAIAKTLERIVENNLPCDINSFHEELDKTKEQLKKEDPLYNEKNLDVALKNNFYNTTIGILDGLNPWRVPFKDKGNYQQKLEQVYKEANDTRKRFDSDPELSAVSSNNASLLEDHRKHTQSPIGVDEIHTPKKTKPLQKII